MMNKTFISIVLLLLTALLFSGCAINRATATAEPTFDPIRIKSMYVTKNVADGR